MPLKRAAYLNLSETEWEEKLSLFERLLHPCTLCPRECAKDRRVSRGLCRAPEALRISSANLHYGEEPPITGQNGSGTIFLTHCNLFCLFCQNYPISQLGNGQELSVTALAEKMIALQKRGAHNINFVSPTQYTAQIVFAIHEAAKRGLHLPIVWNSNAYEKLESIQALEGIVDIYLPDIKYKDDEVAKRISRAPDYWAHATEAVKEMHRQVGALAEDENGIAERGLLIRHLVLPNMLSGTKEVLRFIASLGKGTPLSLMAQYFPAYRAKTREEIAREIRADEYELALSWLDEFGLENGYTQEERFRFC